MRDDPDAHREVVQPIGPTDRHLGSRVAAARASRRLSQRTLGRWIARSHTVIGRWEAGTLEPTLFDLADLARAFRVTIEVLVGDAAAAPIGRRRSSRRSGLRRRRAVGSELRAARHHAGLAPIDVWRRCGISPTRVVSIESGAEPSMSELVALRELLGLDLDQLVTRARAGCRSAQR